MAVIIPEIFAISSIPVFLKIKNPETTAIMIENIPPKKAAVVFGNDFVHNLKLQLKSISGIAMGTDKFIIHFCTFSNEVESAPSICNQPQSAGIMPTA